MNNPYLLEPIEEILETALYTASIRDAVPVSLILVSDSGVGKSKMIIRLQGEGIHATDSFTSQGLFELAQNDAKNVLRFLVTPDLNPTLSRKPSTVQSTVANLLSFTTDGTCRIDDGRREKKVEHTPVGLLTACTPPIYDKQAKRWFALGLRRRIIPIFYTYKSETLDALMELTRNNKITGANFQPLKFTFPPFTLPVISKEIALILEGKSKDFAMNLGKLSFFDAEKQIKRWVLQKVVPINPFVTLQALSRAHALRAKRGQVTLEDVEFVSRFISFTDPETPRQI